MVLKAFIDDSESQLGDKRLFLCGYVQSASVWIQFVDEWDAELRADPSIAHLHMVDAWHMRGEFDFRSWSEPRRDEKLLRLAKVIDRHDLLSVECSVSSGSYERLVEPIAPYNLKKPFFACFYGLLFTIARYHHEMKSTVPVEFVFDKTNIGTDALLWFDAMKDNPPEDFKALLGRLPQMLDDEKEVPLQAADMLAWHIRRESETRGTEILTCMPYLRGRKHVRVEITDNILSNWAEKFAKVPHVDLIQKRNQWRRLKRDLPRLIATRGLPGLGRGNFLQRAIKRLTTFIRLKFFRGRNKSG